MTATQRRRRRLAWLEYGLDCAEDISEWNRIQHEIRQLTAMLERSQHPSAS